ncbi:nucleotidyltransferase family protein [Halanaerobium kushneri]|jgi:hypothetical protein|uniref:Uncharacterized protein n=1 Tax=Halanaerobium kushneri TaxID=56779 RepID=A0A1N6UST1_9FIRM|nr:hypothetical protein [Halanaerobium kushneri]SIQ68571.1 hypothetical protein SAMN05421834_10713 [Halanaerobium kushneri]
MKWKNIRDEYPDCWILLEAIEAHSDQEKRVVDKLAVLDKFNNSEIGLLVEFKEGEKTFDNYMNLKFYLEDNLNKDVDLVIKDALKEELKADILGSAKYAQA